MLAPIVWLSTLYALASARHDCGTGRYCLESQTCVTNEGTGRKFGCAPIVDAVICSDERYSCPAAWECDLLGHKCFEKDSGKDSPLLDNVLAVAPVAANKRGFCEIISGELAASCSCVDKTGGGLVNCKIAILGSDRIGLALDIAPCDAPAHVDLQVTEAAHGVNLTVASVEAGTEVDIPIPGLSFIIPKVGNVGVDISAKVDGSLEELEISIGLNACGQVRNRKICGSELTRMLPFWVLRGSHHFFDYCEEVVHLPALLV